MFERFTDRARQVLMLAEEDALGFKHNYIGTEHILLGLIREEEGLAANALEFLDVSAEYVRAEIVRRFGSGEEVTTGHIRFTPHAKKSLELALREALSLGHNYIGTEHLLLALVRDTEAPAFSILSSRGLSAEVVRAEVMALLGGKSSGGISKQAFQERLDQVGDRILATVSFLMPNAGVNMETNLVITVPPDTHPDKLVVAQELLRRRGWEVDYDSSISGLRLTLLKRPGARKDVTTS